MKVIHESESNESDSLETNPLLIASRFVPKFGKYATVVFVCVLKIRRCFAYWRSFYIHVEPNKLQIDNELFER